MSLEIENISYIYGQGTPEEHVALKEVSFTIPENSFVGLVGHTGSGKSTIVQLMNGLLQPSKGRVLVDGINIAEKNNAARQKKQEVGLVFQYPEYQLFEETIGKDIAFGPKNQGCSEEEQIERVKEAMALVEMDYDTWKDRSPFELSGGQKRRVAIAGVIAMKPRYLILDEPTAGLDPLGRDHILEAIARLHKKSKMSIILVSHSMDDVAQYAEHVIAMNQGEKILDGTTEEVFSHGDLLEDIHLGVPSALKLLMALRANGLDVEAKALTVEDAYQEILAAVKRKREVDSC